MLVLLLQRFLKYFWFEHLAMGDLKRNIWFSNTVRVKNNKIDVGNRTGENFWQNILLENQIFPHKILLKQWKCYMDAFNPSLDLGNRAVALWAALFIVIIFLLLKQFLGQLQSVKFVIVFFPGTTDDGFTNIYKLKSVLPFRYNCTEFSTKESHLIW